MAKGKARQQPLIRRVSGGGREVLPGVLLMIVGGWVLAQALFGGLADRLLAWRAYFAGQRGEQPGAAPAGLAGSLAPRQSA